MVFYTIIALLFAVGLASVGSMLSSKGLAALRSMQIFPDAQPITTSAPAQIDTRGPSFEPSPEGESPLFWPSEKRRDALERNQLDWPSGKSDGRFTTPLIDYEEMEKLKIDPVEELAEPKPTPRPNKQTETVTSPLTVDLTPETKPVPVDADKKVEWTDDSERPNPDEVRALVRKVGLSQAVQRLRNSENMSFQEATEFLAQSLRR